MQLKSINDINVRKRAAWLAMNWNPSVCLGDYLIVSERPLHGLRSLRCALRGAERVRDRERKNRSRERERGREERGWVMDSGGGRPHWHHHQAAPDSSYHAWAAHWRAAAARRKEGGSGLRMEERKCAASAETTVPLRRALSGEVITVEQATGHCSSPRRPTDFLRRTAGPAAECCPPAPSTHCWAWLGKHSPTCEAGVPQEQLHCQTLLHLMFTFIFWLTLNVMGSSLSSRKMLQSIKSQVDIAASGVWHWGGWLGVRSKHNSLLSWHGATQIRSLSRPSQWNGAWIMWCQRRRGRPNDATAWRHPIITGEFSLARFTDF